MNIFRFFTPQFVILALFGVALGLGALNVKAESASDGVVPFVQVAEPAHVMKFKQDLANEVRAAHGYVVEYDPAEPASDGTFLFIARIKELGRECVVQVHQIDPEGRVLGCMVDMSVAPATAEPERPTIPPSAKPVTHESSVDEIGVLLKAQIQFSVNEPTYPLDLEHLKGSGVQHVYGLTDRKYGFACKVNVEVKGPDELEWQVVDCVKVKGLADS